ncbi:hypothetical protein HDU96_005216 [Phlyctochytrium bullatum]|nr:hypothetical protein HDU96_005216 [Phlyctochytrium bullatum]
MSQITTKAAPHKHIPLIKFIGPRSKIAHPQLTAPAVKQTVASASPNVSNVIYYDDVKQVPNSFRARPVTDEEINLILVRVITLTRPLMACMKYGGVIWEEPKAPKKKK